MPQACNTSPAHTTVLAHSRLLFQSWVCVCVCVSTLRNLRLRDDKTGIDKDGSRVCGVAAFQRARVSQVPPRAVGPRILRVFRPGEHWLLTVKPGLAFLQVWPLRCS